MNTGIVLRAAAMACGIAGAALAYPAHSSTASPHAAWDYQEPAAGAADAGVTGYVFKTLLGLAVVLGLFFLMFWGYRRFVEPRLGSTSVHPGAVQIVGYTMVGPRASIYLVRAAGKKLVVGLTQQTMVLLAEAPENDAAARQDGAELSEGFRARFREHTARIKRS